MSHIGIDSILNQEGSLDIEKYFKAQTYYEAKYGKNAVVFWATNVDEKIHFSENMHEVSEVEENNTLILNSQIGPFEFTSTKSGFEKLRAKCLSVWKQRDFYSIISTAFCDLYTIVWYY